MGSFLSISISSSIILALLFISYRLVMADERLFTLNRITLYLIYFVSVGIPVYHLFKPAGDFRNEVIEPIVEVEFGEIDSGVIVNDAPVWPEVLLWIYAVGESLVLLRFLFSFVRIAAIIRDGKIVSRKGKSCIVLTDNNALSPFSFIKYIVLPAKDYDGSNDLVIIHEETHIGHRHWIDLIIANLFAAFQWYNPAAWLMIEEFKNLHEYQADDSVINSGNDIKEYQYMLIRKAVGERLPSPANSLNHSKLKKRVTMMYKKKPRIMRRVAGIATVPALIAGVAIVNSPAVASVISETRDATLFRKSNDFVSDAIIASADDVMVENPRKVTNFSDTDKNEASINSQIDDSVGDKETVTTKEAVDSQLATAGVSDNDSPNSTMTEEPAAAQSTDNKDKPKEVYVSVEHQAEFPGGMSGLMQFLAQNIRYPESAFKNDVEGRVIVKFIINQDGTVEAPVVVKGVDPALDAEAIRVVKEMPKWSPAKVNSVPVTSWFTIPIAFKLKAKPERNDSAMIDVVAGKK